MAVQLTPPPGDVLEARPAVLVVDDLPEKLLVFRTVLEGLGTELVMAHSGSEALREVLKRDFAVVLLDVNMPDIDGFETAALIRGYKRSAHTPIIFVTAYADEMQTAQGYSLGAVDYIMSPMVPDILRTKVKVFVELHEMQRRVARQAEERLQLMAAETARQAAESNNRRLSFLSRASQVLGGSLEASAGVEPLLALLVPEFACLAVVMQPGQEGEPMQARWAAAHDMPGTGAGTLLDLPPGLSDAVEMALGSGQRIDLTEQDWPALRACCPALQAAVAGSVLPLTVGERVHGALMVATQAPSQEWDALDELALRLSIALENARLYRSLQSEIEERRQAESRLQESNRRKDEFLAMLSHELRNPLAPVRNAVEVMRLVPTTDPKLEWASAVIGRQVDHMTRLVDELLDVARINQGKVMLQLEPVDLREVLAHSVETARPMFEARRHALHQSIPQHGVWLRGDFARLSQVVANLLNNAAKYTEDGGRIQLSLAVEDGEAVIRVRDDGMGIDAELLPRVFELFEQGQRALDRAQGGLGVGLTLAQRLVDMHQGRIEAFSAGMGQGAEFVVRLPCLRDVEVRHEEPPAEEVETVSARVLVVDDNLDSAQSAALFLEMVGHEVRTAGDGAQALALAPSYAPQVVVLDIGLPTMDGYEVARRLRELPATRHALLVALTGYGSSNDRQRAEQAGFDLHLVKPADPGALADAIARWSAGAPERALRRGNQG